MSWCRQLDEAVTGEDFDKIKEILGANAINHIHTPEVLTAYLAHNHDKNQQFFDDTFDVVAHTYRLDLINCFFPALDINQFFKRNKRKKEILLGTLMTDGYVDVTRFLLDNGLNPDEKIVNGTTMLSVACFYQKVDIIDLLLLKGANVNKKNKLGKGPASFAVRSGNVRVLDRLILQGVDLTYIDCLNDSLWAVMLNNPDVAIAQRLADMKVPIEEGLIARILRYGTFDSYHPTIKQMIAIFRSAGCEEPNVDPLISYLLTKETIKRLLSE